MCEAQAPIDGDHLSCHPLGGRIGQMGDPPHHVVRTAAPVERYLLAFRYPR